MIGRQLGHYRIVAIARSPSNFCRACHTHRPHVHGGEKAPALDWLEKAYTNHESAMERIGVVWDWHELRAEPRFQDLLRRLNPPH